MESVNWTRMEDGTKEEFEFLMEQEEKFNADLVDRIFTQLKLMNNFFDGYKVSRYTHSLQCATRAHRSAESEEMVVGALLHDIGDNISPYNHCELAAAMLRPYVSERIYWIVKYHGVFQGYYYNHHLGGDRNARERFKDHPWYDDCVNFCHNYDQNSFDPDYETLPLEFFDPMVRRVFAKPNGHRELES